MGKEMPPHRFSYTRTTQPCNNISQPLRYRIVLKNDEHHAGKWINLSVAFAFSYNKLVEI